MEITCWNCKTVIPLDQAGIDAAIAKMNETKLGFYDVPCASCKKVNRTSRAVLTGITPATTGTKAKVVTRSLRVREDHTITCEVVSGLVFDQVVDVYETWTDGKNTWARIGEGTWAAMEYNGDKLMETIKS
jgi:hypothetical protein